MNSETLKALQKSITHHENLVKSRFSEDIGPFTCALCQRFNCGTCERNTGERCPVHERTGETCCFGSPFYPFGTDYDLNECQKNERISNEEFAKLEQKEVDFLKSLLPPMELK